MIGVACNLATLSNSLLKLIVATHAAKSSKMCGMCVTDTCKGGVTVKNIIDMVINRILK